MAKEPIARAIATVNRAAEIDVGRVIDPTIRRDWVALPSGLMLGSGISEWTKFSRVPHCQAALDGATP